MSDTVKKKEILVYGIRFGLFLAIIGTFFLLWCSFKVSNQLLNYEESCQTYWISWLNKKRSSPGHLVNCTWMNVGRFSLRLLEKNRFVSYVCMGGDILFLPFLTRRQATAFPFKPYVHTGESKHRQKTFWRHKCLMRILIEIISGMRMASKQNDFFGFFFLEKKESILIVCERIWGCYV